MVGDINCDAASDSLRQDGKSDDFFPIQMTTIDEMSHFRTPLALAASTIYANFPHTPRYGAPRPRRLQRARADRRCGGGIEACLSSEHCNRRAQSAATRTAK